MRTYWLSFDDQGFLGVVIVDVSAEDALAAEAIRVSATADGYWLGAAIRKCWEAGVNPGGEVLSVRLDDVGLPATLLSELPRLTLLDQQRALAFRARIDAALDDGAGRG